MLQKKKTLNLLLVLTLSGVFMGCCSAKKSELYPQSKNYKDTKFINIDPDVDYGLTFSGIVSALWAMIFDKSKESIPENRTSIPVVKHTDESLAKMEDYSVIRVAHSTLLFKIEGKFWLIDPVFSKSISPISFIKNSRFHDLPFSIDDLPAIEGVIISHNHYDHLDAKSIKALKAKTRSFYVPLGIAKQLIELGVKKEKIAELDWWEEIFHKNIKLICTPAQHFSGRGVCDGSKTLWASWVVQAPGANLYFSGDSGYFNAFKEIGGKYGPFDMTFIETGAYNKRWIPMHMLPAQSVQAHIDLRGNMMFPIHNGSFDLSLHSWYEPFEKVSEEGKDKNISIMFPAMGEPISLKRHTPTKMWWREK